MSRIVRGRSKRGIYRLELPALGECARVDRAAGDAYPYLEREMYETLGFWPKFEDLPAQSEDDRQRHKPLWGGWQ
jgi:hypothetical protein